MVLELSNINSYKEQDVIYFTNTDYSYTFYIDPQGNLQIKKVLVNSSPISKN